MADEKRDNEPWGEIEGKPLTRGSYAQFFNLVAKDHNEWAGLPIPLKGERLIIDSSYFGAKAMEEINRLCNPETSLRVCTNKDLEEETTIINEFWSTRLNCIVMIYKIRDKYHYTVNFGLSRGMMLFRTLGIADGWSLKSEETALEALRQLVTHQAFRQYLLTGCFLESSKRSKIAYMFRRLRPTVAISGRTGTLQILCTLCLHPVAYYANSWGGAMCPTDDVIAHLMLMRGDEKLFWRRANQHHPLEVGAGL